MASTRLPSRRPGLTQIALLSIAAGVLVTGLAVATWQSHRRQSIATDALLRGHASLVSQRLASRIISQIYIGSNSVFRQLGRSGAGSPLPADLDPERIVAATEEVERCRCAPALVADFAFRVALDETAASLVGPRLPSPAFRDWLTRAVVRQVDSLVPERNWDFTLLPELREQRAIIIAAPVVADGRRVVHGFGFDAELLRTQIIRPLVRGAELTPELGRRKSGESLVWIRIDAAESGASVYRDSMWTDETVSPRLVGRTAVGLMFGGWTIEAAFTPEARALLTADFSSTPVLLLLSLTLATAVAFGVALRFLGRSQELALQRRDFTSSVSHELRTPLTQILLYAETLALERATSPERRRRAVEAIVREARRLLRLVQNVLQHSRAEQGMPNGEAAPLALAPVVAEAIADFDLLARERRARITLEDRTGEARVGISADAARQVVVNLLDNAVRHGPTDQHISLQLMIRKGEVVLTVDDQGPGIPVEDRERIWLPYERGSRAPDGTGEGSGLGLAVVRSLVTGSGGWIEVTAAPGGGARFEVGWPAQVVPVLDRKPAGAAVS